MAARGVPALREYVANELRSLLTDQRLLDGIRAQLLPDAASQARAYDVVVPRLGRVSGLQ